MTSRTDKSTLTGGEQRFSGCLCGHTSRDRRNNRRFAMACALWALCFVGADLVQENLAVSDTVAWGLAVLPLLPAMAAISAFVRFLLEADEMVRAVHLHGLALGFGAAALVMIGIQWPAAEPRWMNENLILFVMMTGWSAGTVWAMWRMR